MLLNAQKNSQFDKLAKQKEIIGEKTEKKENKNDNLELVEAHVARLTKLCQANTMNNTD